MNKINDFDKKLVKIDNTLNIKIEKTNSLMSTLNWSQSSFIPNFVDKFFFKIYKVRSNFKLSEKSTFDDSKDLNSIYKIITYYPISLFKGYFLPYISNWLNENELFGDKVKFLFVYKMSILYLGLIFLVLHCMFNINYNIIYLILFCSFFTSIIVYLYPNVVLYLDIDFLLICMYYCGSIFRIFLVI